jgi:large subunit ribosomal protein L20
MGKLKEKNIILNRKVLADLALNNPEAFEAVINVVKS